MSSVRGNGLRAAAYIGVADLHPQVADVMLAALADEGVAAYVKETGDWDILKEHVPFDNDESRATSLMDHLKRSFDHPLKFMGPHGLPLIGRADWNDWYAQATDGTTWYFGEETADFATFPGDVPRLPELVSIEGSFKWGRDRDKGGRIFLASPKVGDAYLEGVNNFALQFESDYHPNVAIRISELGEFAGAVGAAALALELWRPADVG